MRAGISTIQQTLTPEAAGILNLSIAEAARRSHGQTTPLHVAATLLAAPSGFLRQACIKSHPNSSHPLQCRALELCFRVALERLPTAQGSSVEPPMSNALMAALKRAQANQRRGCPQQQQQPLLAIKVELEQLIISILDDPSVSRVMREASFSSPAVKVSIEQSLNSATQSTRGASSALAGLGFCPSGPPNRSLFLNPRLQQQQGNATSTGAAAAAGPQSVHQRSEDINKVVEILSRSRKRNPVLVGEQEPEAVVKELIKKIEGKELNDGGLKNVQVISLEKECWSDKSRTVSTLKELGDLVEARIGCKGIILDFGDLKWLVDQPAGGCGSAGPALGRQMPQQQMVSEAARMAVVEVWRLLGRFREDGTASGGQVWLIGTATYETYLRCQVHHPSLETDWDLQAVPIATRSSLPGLSPRLGTTGILGNSAESPSLLRNFPAMISNPRHISKNLDPAQKISFCPSCAQGYAQELEKLKAKETEKASAEAKLEAAFQSTLPQWLQNAKIHPSERKDEETELTQRIQELQEKWNETCLKSHDQFHQHLITPERINPTPFSMTGRYSLNPLLQQNPKPKSPLLQKSLNTEALPQASLPKQNPTMQSQLTLPIPSPPRSPVHTDLVLGRRKATTKPALEEPARREDLRDFLGCITQEFPKKAYEFQCEKSTIISDTESFKKLLKGLTESVWWQQDAASALAAIINGCKLGNAKRRSVESRDFWILFAGPDRVGKKRMGSALSELVCGAAPITISLGSRRDNDLSFRGKTALDRIAEGVRRNPFSVIVLEDVDEADTLVRGSISRAMEQGRITDSHGREISLGNVTFILTASWVPDNVKLATKWGSSLDEEKLAGLAQQGWQLKLSVTERNLKRRASWFCDVNTTVKPRKETANNVALDLDLNETVDYSGDRTDGSHNSSDLTTEHEHDLGLDNRLPSSSLVNNELLCNVDDCVIFKPVDLGVLLENISGSISAKFSSVLGDHIPIEIQDEVLERILGGVWVGGTGPEEWTESVLIPSFDQLKSRLHTRPDKPMVVRLECTGGSGSWGCGEWLPRRVELAINRA